MEVSVAGLSSLLTAPIHAKNEHPLASIRTHQSCRGTLPLQQGSHALDLHGHMNECTYDRCISKLHREMGHVICCSPLNVPALCLNLWFDVCCSRSCISTSSSIHAKNEHPLASVETHQSCPNDLSTGKGPLLLRISTGIYTGMRQMSHDGPSGDSHETSIDCNRYFCPPLSVPTLYLDLCFEVCRSIACIPAHSNRLLQTLLQHEPSNSCLLASPREDTPRAYPNSSPVYHFHSTSRRR